MAQDEQETRIRNHLPVDPIHDEIEFGSQQLTQQIWEDKYQWGPETTFKETARRVVEGVYLHDPDEQAKWRALEALEKLLFIPGGRIWASAGTPKITTSINCYVSETIGDSMPAIMDALKSAALTQQQGGGIGMDFSTIRPSGAFLKRTGAIASGPLFFMDMWDSMCATIKSAGDRRGAMMATMHCEHPDLPAFIKAKHEAGKLTNFNVSVLVTDAFMEAVKYDIDWYLGFPVPRADGTHCFEVMRDDEHCITPGKWYAYEKWRARDLWNLILESTYDYAEPGVIFIDRINEENNLNYCETIRCTNPCGEQPLPPYGCCNLGAINLARMVKRPYTQEAKVDWSLLLRTVQIGVRFLDNVIDTAIFPLNAQRVEEFNKRRLGLGITGLANLMEQLNIRYGSPESIELTEKIMYEIAEEAYYISAKLAEEKGAFPLYNRDRFSKASFVKKLSEDTQEAILKHGLRNGVLLTIAPTGTTSILAGNISSGLEPVFLREVERKVLQRDNTYKKYTAYDYGELLWKTAEAAYKADKIPSVSRTTVEHHEVTPAEHIAIQAACQKWVDASISKTVNCPKEMTFEDFKHVYEEAYAKGCKGCTTYRPSDVRGAVLTAPGEAEEKGKVLANRPPVLAGHTYKLKWPPHENSYYITINDGPDGQPFEIFITSTSSKFTDWTTALSLMISAIMRKGDNAQFIPDELKKVASAHDSAWVDGKYYASLVALIGDTIKRHILTSDSSEVESDAVEITPQSTLKGEQCPSCLEFTLHPQEGCNVCATCGYSTCGG